MNYSEFKKVLKDGNLGNLYLFFGEEDFLIDYAIETIKKKIVTMEDFNFFYFFDKDISPQKLGEAIEGYPVMDEKKLVVLKNTGILGKVKEADKNDYAAVFGDIPDYCHVIVVEKEFDKRGSIYKKITSKGEAVEFPFLKQSDLLAQITKKVVANKMTIGTKEANLLLERCGPSLTVIRAELDKVISFATGKTAIEISDIEAVVPKPLATEVFEIVGSAIRGNMKKAFEILNWLFAQKESGVRILSIMADNLICLHRAKTLNDHGLAYSDIVKEMKLPPNRTWLVKNYLADAKMLSFDFLKTAINECTKADNDIKNGKIPEVTAVEMFVLRLGNN